MITLDQLDEKALKRLVENAADFAGANGIVMIAPDSLPVKRFKHVPFTLLPSPVPRVHFNKLVDIQPHVNTLMHRLSLDYSFLSTAIESAVKADDFMENLFEIYKKTFEENKKALTLAVFRTDYILDERSERYKQIEVNTISSSFGGVGTDKMRHLHLTALRDCPPLDGGGELAHHLPLNPARSKLGEGLALAWRAYGVEEAVVVVMVNMEEHNVVDQRVLEYEMCEREPGIVVRREVYQHAVDRITLDETTRTLYIDGEEIAVCYFRTCYMPQHFPHKKHWEARLMIERSKCVKSPSVAHQLVGSKKVQQVLCAEGVVEKYLPCDHATQIRDTFAGLYTLDMGEEGDRNVEMAKCNPDDFVLKPQREGGGNNLYGDELVAKLNSVGDSEERCAYVLMDKIRPRSTPNYIIADSSHARADVVSEVGVFGVALTKGDEVLLNETAGHLLRSKSDKHEDGGVMSGIAVLDSPYLI